MISPSMQPTDQISIAAVYSVQLRSNSGARYQRVTTYSVMKSVSDVVLAKPKSPILRSQLALRSKLLGLRSRCKTLAECTYFNPRNNWYKKYCKIFIKYQFHTKFKLWKVLKQVIFFFTCKPLTGWVYAQWKSTKFWLKHFQYSVHEKHHFSPHPPIHIG